MEFSKATCKIAQIIYLSLPYPSSKGEIWVPRQRLINEKIDPFEIKEVFGILEKEKVINGYKKVKAMPFEAYSFEELDTLVPEETEFEYYHVFFVDRDKLSELFPKEDSSNNDLRSEFVSKSSFIRINGKAILLPPFKNECALCEVMFKYGINEPVDWSLVYESMTGDRFDEIKDTEKEKHSVSDAYRAINKRVIEAGFDNLFVWKDKAIRRLY